jgi:hypothetical protein
MAGAVSARELAAGRFAEVFTDAMWAGGGPERVRRWAQAGCPEGPFEVVYVGDPVIGGSLDAVMHRIPAAVAYHVARSVLFVGQEFGGAQYIKLPRLPPDAAIAHVITVHLRENDELERLGIVAHEIAHFWTSDTAAPVSTAAERRMFQAEKMAFDPADPAVAEIIKDLEVFERRAATLARAWGFTGIATDVDHAIAGIRRVWKKSCESASKRP